MKSIVIVGMALLVAGLILFGTRTEHSADSPVRVTREARDDASVPRVIGAATAIASVVLLLRGGRGL